MSEMGLSAHYEQGLRRNNRLRIRISRRDAERKMQRFKSRGSTSKFSATRAAAYNTFKSSAISRQVNHTAGYALRR
jgi:hypothetical protein